MKEQVIHIPIEDLNESPRPRNNRGGRLAFYSALATIALGIPVLLGYVGKAYQIAEAPNQIVVLAKHQHEIDDRMIAYEASQREIRAGLNRILSAMRLEPIKEPKDKEP